MLGSTPLLPYEQLFLILLDPETGKLTPRFQFPRLSLGLALMSSMALAGRFQLGPGLIPRLELVPFCDTPPKLEAHWLRNIAEARIKRTTQGWLQAMQGDSTLIPMIAESLIRKRILGREDIQVWLFTKRRYRLHYPTIRTQLIDRLQRLVHQKNTTHREEDRLLIRMLSSNGQLKRLFGSDFIKRHRQDIHEILIQLPNQNPVYDYLHQPNFSRRDRVPRPRQSSPNNSNPAGNHRSAPR